MAGSGQVLLWSRYVRHRSARGPADRWHGGHVHPLRLAEPRHLPRRRRGRKRTAAFAEVADGAEDAEVGGVVGAAGGDGDDVIDVESDAAVVGGAAAGAAAVTVALEDLPAEAWAHGGTQLPAPGAEE